ncbi:hypothetical protein CYMTET_50135 [Cymbomonas tetramitiformis]|uniref:Long-chain-alcohol oxidase n=1 Tax=Cymbomonas tetramitiformis TaxID=36881 RepID=A0AAE0BPY0_9CHLO|nr:hypothetical protein CYMTET_50135 [Cymbomonas tetramitiformis]
MEGLNEAQCQTFAALCEAFFPALSDAETEQVVAEFSTDVERAKAIAAFCKHTPTAAGIAASFNNYVKAGLVTPELLQEVKLGLTALNTAFGTFLLCGHRAPFHALRGSEKTAAMIGLSASFLPPKRKLFNSFKVLTALLFLGSVPKGLHTNPAWAAVGYPSPRVFLEGAARRALSRGDTAKDPFASQWLRVTGEMELEVDVVVVGSGVGGAIMAAELARSGHKVLVLEKGRYMKQEELSLVEAQSALDMYERGGLLQSEDGSISMFAGSTFGGGATVNWMCSLQTPHHVRKEWAEEHGLSHLMSPAFQKSLDFVCSRMGVHTDKIPHNAANETLRRGCMRLGYPVEECPQAGKPQEADGSDAGYCCFGWKYGESQGMQGTFLADAARAGARFIDQCDVQYVRQHKGCATGVVAIVAGKHRLKVKSQIVVSSCGSVNTPALLKRSRLQNANIGRYLRLHPVTTAYGIFPEDVAVYEGPPMTMVSKAVQNQDGKGYGALIEVPSAHLAFLSMIKPLRGAAEARRDLLEAKRTVPLIVLTRDRGAGTVHVDKAGRARIDYDLHQDDSKHMLQGMEAAIKILIAAGATKVGTSQAGMEEYHPTSQGIADASFWGAGGWLEKMHRYGTLKYGCPLFSAHQMGTCRMGKSATSSATNGEGEAWELRNLFVADASLFPTPSGTNPMVTCAALSHGIAQHVKARLSSRARL